MSYELGILGAGNMAEAIARGVTRAKLLRADQIIAADVSAERRAYFERELGIRAVEQNVEIARQSANILLSVKPQQMAAVLAELGKVIAESTRVISIAAGISSGFIEKNLGGTKKWRVIRTMPNTPMLVGEGMVAIAAGSHASADDLAFASRLFSSAAQVIEVPEAKIDAVTAMSGSGPAYFFYIVEQMEKAGIELGLTQEEAHTLAARTALGAARMLTGSSDTPAELRRKVTSPNGTTHAAITLMEERGLGKIVIDAVRAADRRSKELGQ